MQPQRLPYISRFINAMVCAVAMVLSGCSSGGGDSNPPPAVAQASVATYVTDNLTTDYAKVWVGIRAIQLVDDQGQRFMMYTPPVGESSTLINLSDLSNVGTLLSNVSIPRGTYHKAIVVLDDEVTLEALASSTIINATFGSGGQPYELEVPIELNAEGNTPLVLDFDLSRFTYDIGTNVVSPVIAQKGGDAVSKFDRTKVEFKATIKSIGFNGGHVMIVVSNDHFGDLQVELHESATTIFKESIGAWAIPKVGDVVEIRGVVKVVDGAPSVSAIAVKIADGAYSALGKITGTVVSKTGTVLEINVVDANFRQVAKTMTLDVANAKYVRGELNQISVGSEVHVAGVRDINGNFAPVFVDASID